MEVYSINNARHSARTNFGRAKKEIQPEHKGPDITKEYKTKQQGNVIALALAALMLAGGGVYANKMLEQRAREETSFYTHAEVPGLNDIVTEDFKGMNVQLDGAENEESIVPSTKEIWEDFPAYYQTTKDSGGRNPNNSNSYEFQEDHEYLYSLYSNMAKIASGEEKPWEDVTSASDANNLIRKVVHESTSYISGSNTNVTSGEDINKGELNVINLVLDKLSENDDKDIQSIARVYQNAFNGLEGRDPSAQSNNENENGRLSNAKQQLAKAQQDYSDAKNTYLETVEKKGSYEELSSKYTKLQAKLKSASSDKEIRKVLPDIKSTYEGLQMLSSTSGVMAKAAENIEQYKSDIVDLEEMITSKKCHKENALIYNDKTFEAIMEEAEEQAFKVINPKPHAPGAAKTDGEPEILKMPTTLDYSNVEEDVKGPDEQPTKQPYGGIN